ncbi:hypothetical protein BJ508DRAFT_333244 [Ascobolus immersus RN42]|uniref:Uncharacterized protein n=1 Tax=Ascobolus immersus RN42 TaxID=1160509 RepID=A0A3N4HQ94_ASCIM|nr:hypothetical protein BJ508DRAFT_333244 [Ascobolus immersus RN42]
MEDGLRTPTSLEYLCLDWHLERTLVKPEYGLLPPDLHSSKFKDWSTKLHALRSALAHFHETKAQLIEIHKTEYESLVAKQWLEEGAMYDAMKAFLWIDEEADRSQKSFLRPLAVQGCLQGPNSQGPCAHVFSQSQLEHILVFNHRYVDIKFTDYFWELMRIEAARAKKPFLALPRWIRQNAGLFFSFSKLIFLRHRGNAIQRYYTVHNPNTPLRLGHPLWHALHEALEGNFQEPDAFGLEHWPTLIYLSYPGIFANLAPSEEFNRRCREVISRSPVGPRILCEDAVAEVVLSDRLAAREYYNTRLEYIAAQKAVHNLEKELFPGNNVHPFINFPTIQLPNAPADPQFDNRYYPDGLPASAIQL